jgi:hypothetical protein
MRLANSMAMYLLSALGFARAVVARVGILKEFQQQGRGRLSKFQIWTVSCAFFLHAFGA